jgi:hypothetical protein
MPKKKKRKEDKIKKNKLSVLDEPHAARVKRKNGIQTKRKTI